MASSRAGPPQCAEVTCWLRHAHRGKGRIDLKISGADALRRRSADGTLEARRHPDTQNAILLSRPRGDLGACPQAELAQNVADLGIRRALRDDELGSNFAIGQPARDQAGDLTLARTESVRFALGGFIVVRSGHPLSEERSCARHGKVHVH